MANQATKTSDKNKGKAHDKAKKSEAKAGPKAGPKTEQKTTEVNLVPATGEAAPDTTVVSEAAPDTTKPKRLPKNYTKTTLEPSNPESAAIWLKDFAEQCKNHPPIKGYDQHWNNLGFIHTGPSSRLENQGAARMFVVLVDIFATRINDGGKEGEEAQSFLDFCMNFAATRVNALKEAKAAAILAEAAAILR